MNTALAIQKVKEFIEEHNFDESHNFAHVMAVLSHVQKMVYYHPKPELSREQAENLNLAAILHDVDDRKFFPKNKGYENARKILNQIFPDGKDWFRIENILYMIGLVSTSSNGNSITVDDSNLWMLYPRFADRLEAIGAIGVERCRLYSIHTGRPLFLPDTERCKTEEELSKIVTPERFENYLKVKESKTMIDHFYDKLLHVGKPDILRLVNNPYLLSEAESRHKYMIDYVLEFGRTGNLPGALKSEPEKLALDYTILDAAPRY